ncbi:polyprenyl synthetase family protein [Sulfobacillus thermosulfidooxidans]|uniref:Heptaprenyl diphosphate synthase n=2 Tax=Sulfobacillus thermosulfidooxidans TaxID=28034 RepID=A0A1W1WGD5_SULTA|nr:polyprenyl synthetase family protein [Sulfobacillus thermosulfidooxidans]OLZ08676.1 trans-hexaprenyltranstransferase [Sulfobacillus thermosulfidooxidans]OLZ17299.1 trans-hexaprenyltranstransferase [Sulfobacillus thermosulfidooxidans]OLZ19384.1 trans-hexaprenyltranstransferase [Sulfobacillus thermosulfidooxidans]PSR27273.1 MAG: polyprenyl synthetase family protein [Sulfobacillus thermosulfidooxidans]SMC05305.1 heptaprenyl diphosphate synthase [Sulfobacillus thermosulfidooxidans DSM 9293]
MEFFSLVEPYLRQVNSLLEEQLLTGNELIENVAQYLLVASGKRLRPALVLLAGQFGTELSAARLQKLIEVATAVEMIHMATLVHDDIIDDAVMRRGMPAVRTQFNNTIAVLAGDFLFALAFRLFSSAGDLAIVDIAAKVVHVMCVGEIYQNMDHGQVATEEAYWRRIEAKTGFFLETSCRLGALATGVPERVETLLGQYGHHIGLAYQVVDDLLDWLANPETLGKAVGEDVAAGVYTLPIIYALRQERVGSQVQKILSGPHPENQVEELRHLLEKSGALQYAKTQAGHHIDKALEMCRQLPSGPAQRALEELAEFVLAREY